MRRIGSSDGGDMKRDIDLRQLRALLSIVEEGGFVRAARALRLSQSTVSESIRALERRLGGAVLRKSEGRVSLTPVGEAMLPYARQMLSLNSELLARVGEVTRDFANQVVVATSESISAYLLPSQLSSLRRRWPRSRIQVMAATCVEVRSALRAGRVDLGLVCEPVPLAGPEAMMVLAPAELVLFATPGHPLAGTDPNPPHLRRYPVQLSDAAGSFRGVLTRYFEAAGLPPPTVMATGSVEGVKRGVLADADSLGLLPSFAVEEELRQGRLARVTPGPPLPSVVLKALWRQDHSLSPMSSELLEQIRRSTGPERAKRPSGPNERRSSAPKASRRSKPLPA
jgi:DNA-binding transcriptional LysR family regulator